MERRTILRCPTCSGPAVEDQSSPDKIRCRNSSCKHNHANEICPRCKAQEIAHAVFKNNTWHYTCGDCEHKWTKT